MSVSCVCCVLSGRGPEDSYCVCVCRTECDRGTLLRRHRPIRAVGRGKKLIN